MATEGALQEGQDSEYPGQNGDQGERKIVWDWVIEILDELHGPWEEIQEQAERCYEALEPRTRAALDRLSRLVQNVLLRGIEAGVEPGPAGQWEHAG